MCLLPPSHAPFLPSLPPFPAPWMQNLSFTAVCFLFCFFSRSSRMDADTCSPALPSETHVHGRTRTSPFLCWAMDWKGLEHFLKLHLSDQSHPSNAVT